MDSQTRLHLINSYGNNQEEGWREGQKGELGKEKEKNVAKRNAWSLRGSNSRPWRY
jgi:hypothetical protein